MNNTELIKALRYCTDNETQEGCDECPYLYNGICHTMLSDAAYALEAAERRIAELEAQIPKEGEWTTVERQEYGGIPFEKRVCSECGVEIDAVFMAASMEDFGDEDNPRFFYCPNCGARMVHEVDNV